MLPKSHPRYESLKQREMLVEGVNLGVTALQGLIAHGRGEAFDYLLGEKTSQTALNSIKAASALLLTATNPVISVNGNSSILCPLDLIKLAKISHSNLEINLFHRTNERVRAIEGILRAKGAKKLYGLSPDEKIEGLESKRSIVDSEGIYSADVVLVALEDGDRTEKLVDQGKKVIAIDLNPLSRTALTAHISIVDNLIRAVPLMISEIRRLKESTSIADLEKIIDQFNNKKNLKASLDLIKSGF